MQGSQEPRTVSGCTGVLGMQEHRTVSGSTEVLGTPEHRIQGSEDTQGGMKVHSGHRGILGTWNETLTMSHRGRLVHGHQEAQGAQQLSQRCMGDTVDAGNLGCWRYEESQRDH